MTDIARPDILCVTHRVPFPPDKGDRIRTYHILRYLSQRANVHLACLADEPVATTTRSALADLITQLAIVPLGRWARRVRALGSLLVGRTASEGAFRSPALDAVLRNWCGQTRFHAAFAS